MKESIKTGMFFGLSSGVITTLGLMIGLSEGTGMRLAVIGGILTIAVADSFADALGIHVSQESSKRNSHKAVWESTMFAFLGKFSIALIFLIPVLLLELSVAIRVSVAMGFVMVILSNYWIAKIKKEKPLRMIGEHMLIAAIVIVVTFFVGKFIALKFG